MVYTNLYLAWSYRRDFNSYKEKEHEARNSLLHIHISIICLNFNIRIEFTMKKRGFTLIELIVTMAILSIILSIGLVRFNVVNKIRANHEIQMMINDINNTKMKAMVTGEDYIVSINKSSYLIYPFGDSKNVLLSRDLEYISINTNKKININYKSSGSVDNPGTINITSRYGDEEKLASLVVTVAGGHTRIDEEEKGIHTN